MLLRRDTPCCNFAVSDMNRQGIIKVKDLRNGLHHYAQGRLGEAALSVL